MSINKVILIGHLGRDPETRHLNNGNKVCNLRLATTERWKKDGEQQEKTEWHSVVIFNEHLVDVAEKYLAKGSKIYLEGQLQTRKWQDQQGNDRYSTEIVLNRYRGELQMLDMKPRTSEEYDTRQSQYNDPHNTEDELEVPF